MHTLNVYFIEGNSVNVVSSLGQRTGRQEQTRVTHVQETRKQA